MTRRIRLKTWAAKDINDERKINYTVCFSDGTTKDFSSDLTFGEIGINPRRLANMFIIDKQLINDEWYIALVED